MNEQNVIEWCLSRAGEYHGCFTGECPHATLTDCVEHLWEQISENLSDVSGPVVRSKITPSKTSRPSTEATGGGGEVMGAIPKRHNETYTQEVARIRRMEPANRCYRDDIIIWQANEIAVLKEQVEALGDGDSDRAALMRCEAEIVRLERVIADAMRE